MRNAGLEMPIMIDAPDCGSSVHAFTAIGQMLVDHDPKHNVLLSAHAYWAGLPYDGVAEVVRAVTAGLPIVLGEIANKQSDQGDECYYGLDGSNQNHPPLPGPSATFTYQDLLGTLAQHEVGWLAWCWWKDSCPARQLTSTGQYANLTPYGQDLVNNVSYGLLTGTYHALRTATLP